MNNQKLLKQGEICNKIEIQSTLVLSQTQVKKIKVMIEKACITRKCLINFICM